jgi:predicted molibdopterin-dependent oxidoreductase YjgC
VADGAASRYFHWSQMTAPEPELRISRELARELKLDDGDIVTVTSDGGEAALKVKTTKRLKGKVVAATIHFPSVRRLFPWKLDDRYGEISLAPIPVTISGPGGKS